MKIREKPISALSVNEEAKLVLVIRNRYVLKPVWQSENWFNLTNHRADGMGMSGAMKYNDQIKI